MKHDTESQLEPAKMHALLTMARELLQTDEAVSVLELVGQNIAELTRASSALLLVSADDEKIIAFDRYGKPRSALHDHPCSRTARWSAWSTPSTNRWPIPPRLTPRSWRVATRPKARCAGCR